ncbi:MAG: hypothetical protein ACXWZR_06195, partial [Mycobacterium sp.]
MRRPCLTRGRVSVYRQGSAAQPGDLGDEVVGGRFGAEVGKERLVHQLGFELHRRYTAGRPTCAVAAIKALITVAGNPVLSTPAGHT